MAFRPVVALYDACILYPFHLRNVVVPAAVDGLVDARWTDAIHDEWMRNLLATRSSLPVERLEATKRLMNVALPAATSVGYEPHIEAIDLPDLDDRHVVAAAIQAGASMIVTWNLRDFPTAALKQHGLMRQSPDDLLVSLYERAPELAIASLANSRRNLRRSRLSATDFLVILRHQRLVGLASTVQERLDDL